MESKAKKFRSLDEVAPAAKNDTPYTRNYIRTLLAEVTVQNNDYTRKVMAIAEPGVHSMDEYLVLRTHYENMIQYYTWLNRQIALQQALETSEVALALVMSRLWEDVVLHIPELIELEKSLATPSLEPISGE